VGAAGASLPLVKGNGPYRGKREENKRQRWMNWVKNSCLWFKNRQKNSISLTKPARIPAALAKISGMRTASDAKKDRGKNKGVTLRFQ